MNLSAPQVVVVMVAAAHMFNSGLLHMWQTCTEVIYFPNTNNVTDMFPPREWTFDNLKAHCSSAWSVQPRPTWLKTYTGGQISFCPLPKTQTKRCSINLYMISPRSLPGENIKYSSRIIFSNGLLDPWHGGGFLESLSDSLIAIIIEVPLPQALLPSTKQ